MSLTESMFPSRRAVRIRLPEDRRPRFLEVVMEPPEVGASLALYDRDTKQESRWMVTAVQTVIDYEEGSSETGTATLVVDISPISTAEDVRHPGRRKP